MNETQRQAYLHAMEIQVVFPRVSIPGAKPSPLYQIAPLAIPPTIVMDVAATPPRPPARTASEASMQQQKKSPSAVRTAAVDVATGQAMDIATDAFELRFRLNYYQISESVAVIDEIPYQGGKDSAATLTLLKAILRALEVDFQAATFKPEPFNWPLETGIVMKNDPAVEARNALLGYVAMRQQKDKFRHLIIFAAQVADLLLGEGSDAERAKLASNGTCHISVTHSLQSQLSHPILKREVWSHLQPLRRRLADK